MKGESKAVRMAKTLARGGIGTFEPAIQPDFRFSPLNAFLLVGLFVIGLFVHLSRYEYRVEAVLPALGSGLGLALLLGLFQAWQ